MRTNRAALGAAAVLAALALVACDSGAPASDPPGGPPLLDAVERTRSAGTARIRFELLARTSAASRPVRIVTHGFVDIGGRRAALTTTQPWTGDGTARAGATVTVKSLLDGRSLYVEGRLWGL